MDKHLLIWESERNQYINHVFPYINDIFVINQVIKFHGSSHHQSDQIHPHLGLCFSHGSMKKWVVIGWVSVLMRPGVRCQKNNYSTARPGFEGLPSGKHTKTMETHPF